MATGLADQFEAATDIGFQKKVAQAMAQAAVAMFIESPGTVPRRAYAITVASDPPSSMIWMGNPVPHARTFALALVLAGQGVDATTTDTAIYNAVLSTMGALAGT